LFCIVSDLNDISVGKQVVPWMR